MVVRPRRRLTLSRHRISPPNQAGGPPKSVAIIGAGPGGLATAMLMARAGCDVTVYERHDRVGGRSATIAARAEPGTFRFDMGPTFFLYPRVLADIFAACDRQLAKEIELIQLDPHYHLIFEQGGEIHATSDMARLAEQVARLAPADAAALPRFMADNRAKLKAFRPILESAFDSPRALMRRAALRALPLLRPLRSVDADLATYFRDPRVRLAFSFQSKYLGMSPFRCPSLFTILSFLEYEHGVFHPRGGCGAVMDAMARTAEDLGARIRLEEPVEEIIFEGRRAVGVRTRSGIERHAAVVINADFAYAMRSLVADSVRRRWKDRRLAQKKFSCSTFMLYLGIEGQLDELAHHTVHLARDYRRNIDEIEHGRSPPLDPSFYVQNACVTDPGLAPPGHSTLYMLMPVSNNRSGIDWPAEQARYRALALRQLEKIGVHGLEQRIRYEKILTPAGWEQDMNIYQGATFNLSHSLGQLLHRRPHNRFEDLENVYLVGGGTHPGSGLPVIFEGARITARLLAEDLELDPHWKGDTMDKPPFEPVVAESLA